MSADYGVRAELLDEGTPQERTLLTVRALSLDYGEPDYFVQVILSPKERKQLRRALKKEHRP